jgi:hypothetical protein
MDGENRPWPLTCMTGEEQDAVSSMRDRRAMQVDESFIRIPVPDIREGPWILLKKITEFLMNQRTCRVFA